MSSEGRTRSLRRLGWLRGDGRWRVRTAGPEATVIDETTVDLDRAALERRVDVAENRLLDAQATLNAVIDRTRHPHFGAAMTREELVGQFRDYLLEVYADVIGVKTS